MTTLGAFVTRIPTLFINALVDGMLTSWYWHLLMNVERRATLKIQADCCAGLRRGQEQGEQRKSSDAESRSCFRSLFENRRDDMPKLGSDPIVRRSRYHRLKTLDEIFAMAINMDAEHSKLCSKVATKTQAFRISSPPIELFDPNLGQRWDRRTRGSSPGALGGQIPSPSRPQASGWAGKKSAGASPRSYAKARLRQQYSRPPRGTTRSSAGCLTRASTALRRFGISWKIQRFLNFACGSTRRVKKLSRGRGAA